MTGDAAADAEPVDHEPLPEFDPRLDLLAPVVGFDRAVRRRRRSSAATTR